MSEKIENCDVCGCEMEAHGYEHLADVCYPLQITQLNEKMAAMVKALEAISMIGGNLPDDRFTSKTGPNDAAQRGMMYCAAREIARLALAAATEGK